MWYRAAHEITDKVEEVARQVAEMPQYDFNRHWELIVNNIPRQSIESQKAQDELDHRLQGLYTELSPLRAYNEIHPQIYLYPSESAGVWRYLLFDPKHLRRIDNPDYHEKLSTPVPISEPVSVAEAWAHKQYPTATIDFFASEAEMLAQE